MDNTESFTSFSRRVDGSMMTLKVSVQRCEMLHREAYPYRVWAVASYQAPGADGFPLDAEANMIEQAERELVGRLDKSASTIYLGSIMHRGRHVVIFHSKKPDPFGPGPSCRVSGSRYQWDVYTNEDPFYIFVQTRLMPTSKEQRRIRDSEVIGALAEANDQQEAPRPLTFYGLFPEQELAEQAAEKLAAKGFRMSPPSEMPGKSALPWSLMFTRTSATDPESIEQVSSLACEACENCGGTYDGWACEPVCF